MGARREENFRFAGIGSLRAVLLPIILGILQVITLLWTLGTVAAVSAPEENNVPASSGGATFASAASPSTTAVHITKTIGPSHLDTGGKVSVCFTIRRPGLDVVLVQDDSGSMDDPAEEGGTQTRLEASQVAANTLVSHLQSTDRGAVVPYSTTAYLAQPLTTTKSEITGTIEDLVTGGFTNIADGIKEGREELINHERYMSETVKAMVLLSDGNANCPEGTAEEDALREAEAAAADDIKIYTIGFGGDVNTELLETIAMTTSGEYYFAPDSGVLETVYLTIAVKLRKLVITDILTAGVEAVCPQEADYVCSETPGVGTIVTWPVSDIQLMTNPLPLCFTATVNLDPDYEGPINDSSSGFCYQNSDGQTICPPSFDNPTIIVRGRKIMGDVFYDVDASGDRDAGETGAPGVIVRTSMGLTTETNASGTYMLRTSSEPAISVTVEIPPGYVATTPISRDIPYGTGIRTAIDFGIRALAYLPVVTRDYPPPVNGGFENGWTGWTHGGELSQTITSTNPYWGNLTALLGNPAYECRGGVPLGSAWMEQTVRVPSTASPELSFWYNIFTHDKDSTLRGKYDTFDVKINGGLVFRDMNTTNPYKCDNLRNLGWRQATIDLGHYSRLSITIRFENWSRYDHWYNTWTYVDDVQIVP
jgi:Mg-chelatase subunit ChlD